MGMADAEASEDAAVRRAREMLADAPPTPPTRRVEPGEPLPEPPDAVPPAAGRPPWRVRVWRLFWNLMYHDCDLYRHDRPDDW